MRSVSPRHGLVLAMAMLTIFYVKSGTVSFFPLSAAQSMAFSRSWKPPPPRAARMQRLQRMNQGRKSLCSSCNRPRTAAMVACGTSSSSSYQRERGLDFLTGDAFYRAESAQSRDLAVLAALVHRNDTGQLDVLDLMSGSGVRALRYFRQAQADSVWANDWNHRNQPALVSNAFAGLTGESPQSALERVEEILGNDAHSWKPEGLRRNAYDLKKGNRKATVSQMEASRLLASCYLREQFFDLVDVDSFGTEAPLRLAIECVKFGGLIYLTSTDGLASAGHRPEKSLAAYGAYMSHQPFVNEQGLRMVIGSAVREAASQGKIATPLFSLYSSHGPVFRCMLRITRSRKWPREHYGFLAHNHVTGESRVVPWEQLMTGKLHEKQHQEKGGRLVMSGPMWTGPLHDETFIEAMQTAASELGWTGNGVEDPSLFQSPKTRSKPLEEVLEVLQEESNLQLRPWYIHTKDVARIGKMADAPRRDELIEALREAGYAAARCHIERAAFRTSATMAETIKTWEEHVKGSS
mmetsp:Transcript_33373/g.64509  ORF Transcript_33373/g.64509 Transcript_33373/m.64509 type:complete len:522 (+) Transcript_33373:54-1619(+)